MNSDSTGGNRFEAYRFFLKDTIRLRIDFSQTHQSRNLPPPPLQKPCPPNAVRISLPEGRESLARLARMSVAEAIVRRESIRNYTPDAMTLEELSAVLYGVQGVRAVISPDSALRTVPSAGARHSFETYVAANRIEGLSPGVYRYLPFDGELVQVSLDPRIGRKAAQACLGQMFIATAAATLFWTTIPARMEWRYDLAAHKVIALDAGHVVQNLYLVCTCLGAGACAVAAYHQDACDRLLEVDGTDEFTVYLAAIGKRRP